MNKDEFLSVLPIAEYEGKSYELKYCNTCNIIRDLRVFHCKYCDYCVFRHGKIYNKYYNLLNSFYKLRPSLLLDKHLYWRIQSFLIYLTYINFNNLLWVYHSK